MRQFKGLFLQIQSVSKYRFSEHLGYEQDFTVSPDSIPSPLQVLQPKISIFSMQFSIAGWQFQLLSYQESSEQFGGIQDSGFVPDRLPEPLHCKHPIKFSLTIQFSIAG